MYISLYYNVLQDILSYIIIEIKMQHDFLPKKRNIYIYTHTQKKKNQDIDFFTYIYIIHVTV